MIQMMEIEHNLLIMLFSLKMACVLNGLNFRA